MTKKRITAGLMAMLMMLTMASCGNTDSSSTTTSGSDSIADTSETAMPETAFTSNCDGTAKVTVDGTDFKVGDSKLWFNGVNSPWQAWNDFGGGAFDFLFWNDHFQELHNNGVNAARIWISCNGDVGMVIAEDGTFSGPTTQFWTDLDDLFMLAENYQIYIMATVQSFDHYKDTNVTYQSWRALIQDSDKIDQYVENYIVPLAKRYDSCDYLWSIDLCNEPDWIVEEEQNGNIDWSYLTEYYAKAAAAIHANSDVLVTVGMGMPKYNSDMYEGNVISDENLASKIPDGSSYDKSLAYVDFYSSHWYQWEASSFSSPFRKGPEDYGMGNDKPNVIGEFSAKPQNATLTEQYQTAYDLGWDGCFAWKASGQDDGNGTFDDISPTTREMLSKYESEIFPLGYSEL